ncbi:uncharacterized protein EV154DRAFT_571836 [Mucor mucedo]|uniref:uncharacterized protein n=1 Tax=Mucor mucedo TaxID=29922 RepID=UPI0022207C7F|nr:uncharacterized protein EV154DRAFT_571836 [Mucor mucedo]KAI7866955.1 hypothetical protein EV154DRAFT_571836 [Mucor mucedo]
MKSVYLIIAVLFVSICVVFAQDPSSIVATTPVAATSEAAATPIATTEPPVAVTTTVAETTTAAAVTTTVAVTSTTDAATASPSTTAIAGDCLSADAFSTTDYFPNKLDLTKLDASAQFSVTYSNTYKLVHNIALDEYYVLYCTKAQPDVGKTFQSKTFIQIPVTSFAAIDTRALGYLDVQ